MTQTFSLTIENVMRHLAETGRFALEAGSEPYLLKFADYRVSDNGLNSCSITIGTSGQEIAVAKFNFASARRGWFSDIWVDPERRRQGIATAIYDTMRSLGVTLVPSAQLDEDGLLFWEARMARDAGKHFEHDVPHELALEETGFWGRRGAGCLIRAQSTGRYLVALRSQRVLEPGTWGTWGGAVPDGVSAEDSVLTEIAEETGFAGSVDMVSVFTYRHPASGFSYENFVAIVDEEFQPHLNWESDGSAWVAQGQWPEPMHFGLASLLEAVPDLDEALAQSVLGEKSRPSH